MSASSPPNPERVPLPDGWPATVAEARAEQERLRGRVVVGGGPDPDAVRLVAGVDAGFPRGRGAARGAAALLSWPGLEVVASAVAETPVPLPYVPGYLSFRELPAVLAALDRLGRAPDLVVCDGQGLAHPLRFGLACHLGVILGLPCIGAAKSRLTGAHDEPGPERGDRAALRLDGEQVGWVLRTRAGVKPLYVSPGHLVGVDEATDWVLRLAPRLRLPETTRAAHALASPT